jgi:hypothetical protein
VFWQPAQSVDYESINVQDDAGGMDALRSLGARSVPVVAVGERYVYAQSLADVIEFLGLGVRLKERLTPDELAQRVGAVLAAALRYVRQIPANQLDAQLRNRKRSIHELAHHVFRIVEAFVEAAGGAPLTYESTVLGPGPDIKTKEDIARYGEIVVDRFERWWADTADRSCASEVDTYYGPHSLHEVLERTAWHSAQHTRQLMMLLEELAIAPEGPLTQEELAGLPLPEKVWDD